MGKYDKVLKKLPPLPAEDLKYQEKVNAVKAQILHPENEQGDDRALKAGIRVSLEVITREVASICEDFTTTHTLRHASVLERRYSYLRDIKEHLEEHLSELQLILTAYEQLTLDQYTNEGVKTVKFDDGTRSYRSQPTVHVRLEDNAKMVAWAKKNGLGDLLTIPWPTLNSHVAQLLLAGQPEPPGVKAFVRDKLHKNAVTQDDIEAGS